MKTKIFYLLYGSMLFLSPIIAFASVETKNSVWTDLFIALFPLLLLGVIMWVVVKYASKRTNQINTRIIDSNERIADSLEKIVILLEEKTKNETKN